VNKVPNAMATPTQGSLTTSSQIEINWVALQGQDTGNSAITSYNLQMEIATDVWQDIVGASTSYLQTSFLLIDSVSGGQTYKFRVRALNIYGAGDFSSSASIIADGIPDRMVAVSIVKDPGDNTKVLVSWTAPNFNHQPNTAYDIQF
jgi:hypothetical protein